MAFQDDLGVRRQRQAGEVGGEQLDRRALDAGIIFVLALGLGQGGGADQEQQRIDAIGGGDRRRLAHLPPLVAVGAGVLAGRGVDADLARALDHHAVGADVHAAAFRVHGDDGVVGAEIHAAVERPHPLRGELANVDLVALDDVLAGDGALGRHLDRLHLPSEFRLQQFHRLERMIDRLLADHQAEPRQVAADHVVERLVAGMALDVLEQQRRAFFQADQIGDVGGFEVGADLGGDALEFAHRLGFFQPDVEFAGVAAVAGLAFRLLDGRGIAADLYAHFHDACSLAICWHDPSGTDRGCGHAESERIAVRASWPGLSRPSCASGRAPCLHKRDHRGLAPLARPGDDGGGNGSALGSTRAARRRCACRLRRRSWPPARRSPARSWSCRAAGSSPRWRPTSCPARCRRLRTRRTR